MGTYVRKGDALKADKIVGQAREVQGPTVIQMSGGHRGRRVSFNRDAYCVIEREFRALLEKKPEKKPS